MKIEQREWLWSLLFTTILAVIFLAAAINIVLAVWGLFDDGGHREYVVLDDADEVEIRLRAMESKYGGMAAERLRARGLIR